jgi:formylglycine-generating enzyme required for sulfatase activity
MKILTQSLSVFLLLGITSLGAQAPVVTDISYAQRMGADGNLTKLVDIQYNLEGNRSMFVEFFFSHDGGVTFPVACTSVTGAAGPGVEYGVGKTAVWDAAQDWNQNFTDRGRIMVKANYGNQPTGFPGLDGNGSGSGPAAPSPTHIVPSADNLEMFWVDPGTFTMGQVGVAEPVHEVTLSEGFYLGKFEVTQAQYEAVMTANADGLSATPSDFGGYPNYPVEQVSWDDVQVFLSRLNNLESANIPAGWAYVLPTEAQWEYACRAGTTTDYSWGDDINASQANYSDSNNNRPLNVGQYAPNPWGFFDMHGNVWEWTADWYGAYPTGNPVVDPTGPASGSVRVARGGSWYHAGTSLRSAGRNSNSPSHRSSPLGFRVGFLKQ